MVNFLHAKAAAHHGILKTHSVLSKLIEFHRQLTDPAASPVANPQFPGDQGDHTAKISVQVQIPQANAQVPQALPQAGAAQAAPQAASLPEAAAQPQAAPEVSVPEAAAAATVAHATSSSAGPAFLRGLPVIGTIPVFNNLTVLLLAIPWALTAWYVSFSTAPTADPKKRDGGLGYVHASYTGEIVGEPVIKENQKITRKAKQEHGAQIPPDDKPEDDNNPSPSKHSLEEQSLAALLKASLLNRERSKAEQAVTCISCTYAYYEFLYAIHFCCFCFFMPSQLLNSVLCARCLITCSLTAWPWFLFDLKNLSDLIVKEFMVVDVFGARPNLESEIGGSGDDLVQADRAVRAAVTARAAGGTGGAGSHHQSGQRVQFVDHHVASSAEQGGDVSVQASPYHTFRPTHAFDTNDFTQAPLAWSSH